VLIDTAGVRRRSKVDDLVERVSVAKTLQAIEDAHVVILVLDAHDAIAEQDASVLGLALERGRALIIAVNKWDGIEDDQRTQIRRQLDLKLDFVQFARNSSSPRAMARELESSCAPRCAPTMRPFGR